MAHVHVHIRPRLAFMVPCHTQTLGPCRDHRPTGTRSFLCVVRWT